MINNIFKLISVISLVIFVAFFSFGILNISSSYKNQISVSGSAKKDISNQIAEFTLTFTSENKDKSSAENQNNLKVKKLLDDLKIFGIPEADIITESLNVYQKQEETWDSSEGRNKWTNTDWVFSQSIRIKIREVSKVNEFTNLASKNETSNIYGPNFTVDTQNIDESEVYNLAFENAKKKAEGLASQSGRALGKAMYISETSNSIPTYPMFARTSGMGGGASAEVPAGTSEISKTLNVVFELR
jgi:uncharacterized protein YggE